jgi:hypothetical protein
MSDTKDITDLSNQLAIANGLRTNEHTIIWVVFSIFLATNVILLGVLFQNTSGDVNRFRMVVISYWGVFLSVIWLIVEYRAVKKILFYESLVANLENELQIPEKFRTTEKNTNDSKTISAQRILKYVPLFGLLVLTGMVWFYFAISLMSPLVYIHS